jgi:hemerythrin-like domain-containing protein
VIAMLHSIGKRPEPKSEELVDLLLACHSRIRSFLDLAIAVGERTDAPEDEAVDAVARVRRYFADALPLHVADEEESVLPRLYGRSAALDAALDRMCVEHDEHLPPLRRLLALCDGNARVELGRAALALRAVLEPHLREEESVVFGAIRELLSAEERRAIVEELRARRRRT